MASYYFKNSKIWYSKVMNIVLVTAVISSLFLVIGAAEPLAARLRLPYTVILAILGILIGSGAIFFLRTELTDALKWPIALLAGARLQVGKCECECAVGQFAG